ncbi:MAG TPA: hypothetical protein VIA18_11090 [Polyangia bacterium]|jgi:hypothetical protein|nr:hypothetical protein [Polyangia bacterium]
MSLPRALLSLVLLAAWNAPAAAHHPLRVVPSVFDPGATDAVASAWRPFDHVGRALVMSKQTTTATDAAALATVENVDGERLEELGFDYWTGGHCSGGAARFDVTTEDGTVYFFGCADGKHTPSPLRHDFTRVRFRDADAAPQLVTDPPWPGFGHVRVKSVVLVFDEGIDDGSGIAVLDDIDVNGIVSSHGEGCD